jgi:hypothetical protein
MQPMPAKSTTTSAKKATAAILDTVAFVTDAETEATLTTLANQQQTGPLHVARGSVRDAIRFLEKQERSPRLMIVDVTGADMPLGESSGPFAEGLKDLTAALSGQPRKRANGWLRLVGRG